MWFSNSHSVSDLIQEINKYSVKPTYLKWYYEDSTGNVTNTIGRLNKKK